MFPVRWMPPSKPGFAAAPSATVPGSSVAPPGKNSSGKVFCPARRVTPPPQIYQHFDQPGLAKTSGTFPKCNPQPAISPVMSFAYFNCFGRAYDRRRARIRSLALAQDHLPSPGVTASLLPPTARPQLSVPGAFRQGLNLPPNPPTRRTRNAFPVPPRFPPQGPPPSPSRRRCSRRESYFPNRSPFPEPAVTLFRNSPFRP